MVGRCGYGSAGVNVGLWCGKERMTKRWSASAAEYSHTGSDPLRVTSLEWSLPGAFHPLGLLIHICQSHAPEHMRPVVSSADHLKIQCVHSCIPPAATPSTNRLHPLHKEIKWGGGAARSAGGCGTPCRCGAKRMGRLCIHTSAEQAGEKALLLYEEANRGGGAASTSPYT